jgi:glycosyltransferase involved in cell wall biosynthesis
LRIGFDARLISSLGIGRYISGLLPFLAEILGDRLVVIGGRSDIALLRALTEGRAQLIVSNARPYRLAEQSLLLRDLAKVRLPLIHFPHYNLPLAYPGRFVVTIHDLFSFRFPDIHSGPLPRAFNRALITNAVGRAAAIIAPSRATSAEVADRFPSAKSRLIAIGEAADARFSAVRNPAAEAAWQRYFEIRPPFFLYLGQWKTYKNVLVLIQAFAEVIRSRPDVRLVIAGHDPRHPEIATAAASLPAGAVVLPGHLPEDAIADLYRSATAVVVPSRAEGFGLPVLEGMACGVPVICSDLPVLRELADGVAIFCDPSSPTSFAAGMSAVLDSDDRDRIQRGIARAGTYTWKSAAEETATTYERVLAGRPRSLSDTN